MAVGDTTASGSVHRARRFRGSMGQGRAECARLFAPLRLKTARNSSVAYLRSLLDAGSEGILVVRPDGVILDLTDSGARILGAAADSPSLIGRHLSDELHPEYVGRATAECSWAARQPNPSGPFRWRLRHGDGSQHVEVVIHNKARDPNISGLILVLRDITPVRALELRLRNDAFRDTLTGLRNRVGFYDKIRIAITHRASDAMVAVLFLDLDDFKAVNDSRGHAVGDELLCEAADRLQASVRPKDAVGRIGGDEFVILLEDIARPEQAGEIAQRVIEAFREAFLVDGGAVRVQTSVGIALSQTGDETAETLLRDADMAMYAAKARGKAAMSTSTTSCVRARRRSSSSARRSSRRSRTRTSCSTTSRWWPSRPGSCLAPRHFCDGGRATEACAPRTPSCTWPRRPGSWTSSAGGLYGRLAPRRSAGRLRTGARSTWR